MLLTNFSDRDLTFICELLVKVIYIIFTGDRRLKRWRYLNNFTNLYPLIHYLPFSELLPVNVAEPLMFLNFMCSVCAKSLFWILIQNLFINYELSLTDINQNLSYKVLCFLADCDLYAEAHFFIDDVIIDFFCILFTIEERRNSDHNFKSSYYLI